ncbi:MAG TPA: Gfo/Idh/MocA family oxidoreductase [Bryobacteraceae bacterium]|nr:Gfo/Idh/MocA family oxidoreductase [Bryobacteraceae bacterium]
MRIAILGLGFMGSTHVKALQKIPSAKLVAVASQEEKRLAGDLSDIQGNIGGPGEKMDFSQVNKYWDAEEAVRDPAVEAVDICLPTDQHTPIAIAALRAGKHVLVEKPMALDGAAADQMMREAEKSGRILMVAQVLRFFPSYRAAADLVRSGKLGQIRSALFRRRCAAPGWSQWMQDSSKSGGGVFDLLIHDVDIALHMLGAPEAVSATGYEAMPRGIDTITAQFVYPKINTVTVTGGWHHPKAYPFSMEFTVVGDEGTLEFSSDGRPLTLYRANGEQELVETPEVDGYLAELRYFLECAEAGRKPELCPPEESAAAVKWTRRMVESRSKNGEKLGCL